MRRRILAACAAAFCLTTAARGQNLWRNALRPEGDAVPVRLVDNGQTGYAIVPGGLPASGLLREGLTCATGLAFPTEDATLIPILLEDDPSSGDAYTIAVGPSGALHLTGNTVNAAAALLEEDFGVRFYSVATGMEFPGDFPLTTAEVVPRGGDNPLEMRFPNFTDHQGARWEEAAGWRLFNRVRRDSNMAGWTHDFTWLVPNELMGGHPEYFALADGRRLSGGNTSADGQLCLTDPGLLEYLIAACREKAAWSPRYLMVSQNDYARWCQCENCSRLFRDAGSQAGPLLHAVNQVAAALRESHPGVTVMTDAYIESRVPPRHIRPAENVAIQMCLSDRIKFTRHLPVAETVEGGYLQAWSRLCGNIRIWDYCVDFSDYLLPCADLPVLEANLDFYLANNVRGIMNLGNYSATDTAQKRLRAWVLSKKFWNPAWPMAELVRDFNYGYFGPDAGKSMQRYSELLDEEWERWYASRTSDHFQWSDQFLPQAEAYFRDALAAAGDGEYRHRVEREWIAVLYLRLITGSAGASDGLSVDERIETLLELCRRHGIGPIQENGSTIDALIPRFRSQDRELALAAAVPPGTRHLLPATRGHTDHDGILIEDPAATLGMALATAGGAGAWSIHWRLDEFPDIELDRSYRVLALVRADLRQPEGEVLRTSWWNAVTDAKPGVCRSVDASELSSAEYRWVECGTVTPREAGLYLVFGSFDDDAAARVCLQGIVLAE